MLRRLRQEDGMTLILAVGILAILTIVSTTMITYTSSSARNAGYQRSEDITIDLAEAGLARALSKLSAAPNALAPTLLAGDTYTLDGGTVTVSGVLAAEMWNITSKSFVPNPAGGAELSKTLTMQVQIGIDPTANNAWNYVYSDAPESEGCMVLKNNVVIASPLFVKGDLCLQNNARAEGSMVKTGGEVYINGNGASIGNPATSPITYVPELKTGQGCKRSASATPSLAACTTANRVWATATTSDPGTLEKPNVDFSYWYTYSRPGPVYDCTATTGNLPKPAGHATMFDSDTTLDRDRVDFDPMPSNPYSCTVTSGANLLGKISWTPDNGDADDFGELQVLGTVFFDGNITFNSGRKAIYTGRGTMYASGRIVFDGNTQVCGATNCDLNAWDTEANLLVLVSGYCNDVVLSCDYGDRNVLGFDVNNNAIFQGASYAVGNFNQQNNGQMQGPVIAHQMIFENNGIANKWVAIEAMTMGTPGAGRKLNIITTGF